MKPVDTTQRLAGTLALQKLGGRPSPAAALY
jgi:hypothetical protein